MLITPVSHKGESQLFYLIFLLFFVEHTDCSSGPNWLRIFQSEITASKYTKANTNHQSHSEIYDLHARTLYRIKIWLSEWFCPKLTWKGINPARRTSFTWLLYQASTVQFTASPFTRTQLQFYSPYPCKLTGHSS